MESEQMYFLVSCIFVAPHLDKLGCLIIAFIAVFMSAMAKVLEK